MGREGNQSICDCPADLETISFALSQVSMFTGVDCFGRRWVVSQWSILYTHWENNCMQS